MNQIDWKDIPEELRETLLSIYKQAVFDAAIGQESLSARDVIKNIFSAIYPVGQVCTDVRDAQSSALDDAAIECGADPDAFYPAIDFELF